MDEQEQHEDETPTPSPADALLADYFASEAFKNLMAEHGRKMIRSMRSKLARAEKRLAIKERFRLHGRQYRKNWDPSQSS